MSHPAPLSTRSLLARLEGPTHGHPTVRRAIANPEPLTLNDFKNPERAFLEQRFGKQGLAYFAVLELTRRAQETPLERFENPNQVYRWARTHLAALDHEELWCLSIAQTGRLLGTHKLAQGGSAALTVSARDILRTALRHNAHGIVLLHNHPSGDPTPSEQDRWFTTSIRRASNIVGVSLVDHLVVTADKYVSMREKGYLEGL